MKTFTILLLITLASAASCDKYDSIKNDADSKYFIYGRLFIQDTLNDNGTAKPLLKDVDVTLYYKSNPLNVLYTTKSNSEGYFNFQNLKKDSTYVVTAQTEKGEGSFKVTYSGEAPVTLTQSVQNCTPVLKLDRKAQNGALFTVKDNTGGLINGAEICFFSSRQIWLKDTCSYGLFSVTTNERGLGIKINVLPGKYYLLFKKQAGTLKLNHADSIEIAAKGIVDTLVVVR